MTEGESTPAAAPDGAAAPSPGDPPTASPSMFAIFRKRDFRFLWTAQLVSTIGSSLTDLAAGILIFQRTNSAFAVGLMRASMVAIIAACALWGMSTLGRRLSAGTIKREASAK